MILAGLRQNPISVILLGILACCVFLYAADQVARYARYADLQYWARQIEKGKPVEAKTLDRLISDSYKSNIEKECQSAFVKPFLTVLLANMDKHNPNVDYERWFQALQLTDTFLQHTLSCLPTDGNLWARYAMIRQASAEQPEEISRLLSLSKAYSPAEENALSARYFLYNRLTEASLASAAAPLGDDLKILCSSMAEKLRSRLPAPNTRVSKVIEKITPSCPAIGNSPDEHRFERNRSLQTVF